jgi:hypothetical protein
MSPQPSSGDYTGKTKQTLAKTATQEQRDRTAEMSMATQLEDEGRREGVWDGQTGQRIDTPLSVEEVEPEDAPEHGGFFPPEQMPVEQVFTGKETDEEMVPHLASRAATPPAPQLLLRQPFVKVRLNADVDDMTYGMRNGEPNNFTFKEGFVYEIEVELAEHLNQRGLVGQWVP